MRTPDSLLIPALIGSELWRRFSRRIRSGPLYRWRFAGPVPLGLTIAPQDLRPADPTQAIEYYSGHFNFGDDNVSTKGESPFSVLAPSAEWFAELHSFRWLRHLRAAETDLSLANASALVIDWIDLCGNDLAGQAWRSDIVASRLIAWLCHAPLFIKNASTSDYRNILKSLARQTRYLHHNIPHMRDGYPRLKASMALAYASLCLSGREKSIKPAARELDLELDRQILPDGGHISRNPVILLQILADLLSLKQAYTKQGHSPSPTLISAVDRMMAALRFFRHSNGDLAQFNGTGFTPAPLLATILRYDESRGLSQKSAPQSGYERLEANKTVVLMDTGKPLSRATARRASAGTLSFELSCGSTRFITNCGAPDSSFDLYAPYVRATAAHSTATLNDTSSSRFATQSGFHKLLPSPLINAPENVTVSRTESDKFQMVEASHDGYLKKFSITHRRELQLSNDGNALNGCDFFQPGKKLPAGSTIAAIRFHLPPAISASPLSSGHSILMAATNNDAWTFTCVDGPVVLEESIRFSGPGQPRKCEQIVIYLNPAQQDNIRWVLERRLAKPPTRSRKKAKPGSQTPDLLDALEQQAVEQQTKGKS